MRMMGKLGVGVAVALAAALAVAGPARADESRDEAARERVKKIAAELEAMRGQKFAAEVGVETQSAEDFRKFVRGELDEELPQELADRQSKALQAFGLVPLGYDLRKGYEDLLVSQAGAYYNPETKKFYVLMAGLPDIQLDSIILHELQHALQDQRFDLAKLLEKARAATADDADRASAVQFLVEGEATYVMLKYQLKKVGMDIDKAPADRQDLAMKQVRDIDRKTLLVQARLSAPGGPEGAELKKAIESLKDVPPFLFLGLHDPYFKGQYAVFKAFSEKGWAGVDALFETPPTSTEQILHPEKLTGAERDEPTKVDLPDLLPELGPGWKLVYANGMGEAGVLAFFDAHEVKDKAKLAAGWDGDRYALYEGPGGRTLLYWITEWDTNEDAQEFFEGLAKATFEGKRLPDGSSRVDGKRVRVMNGDLDDLKKLRDLGH